MAVILILPYIEYLQYVEIKKRKLVDISTFLWYNITAVVETSTNLKGA